MGSRLRVARAIVVGLAAGGPLGAGGRARVHGPIPVVAQVPAKTYYVGQAIELRVGAEAAGERPEVDTPEIPNTDVSLIGTELSPVTATGIGNLTSERNLFVTRFRLITHRAGMLRIPPVRARLGTRSGCQPAPPDRGAGPPARRPAGGIPRRRGCLRGRSRGEPEHRPGGARPHLHDPRDRSGRSGDAERPRPLRGSPTYRSACKSSHCHRLW